MTTSITALNCGNAVRLSIDDDSEFDVLVLRRLDENFAGLTDPAATIVYQGPWSDVLDLAVDNGTQYFYQVFIQEAAGTWTPDPVGILSITPAAVYQGVGIDVRKLVKDRFAAGFAQEIARGLLIVKPQKAQTVGAVAVVMGSPMLEGDWPVASVKVMGDAPESRGIGETAIGGDDPNDSMLDTFNLNIVAHSQNPDERHALHESMRRIVQANLEVFDFAGIVGVSWSISDSDFVGGEFPIPVWCAVMSLTFQAPTGIVSPESGPIINGITVMPAVLLPTGLTDTGAPC